MTREYHLADGTPVPAELQEEIAKDVRLFDAAQTPAARAAVTLRKISNDMPRIRGQLEEIAKAADRLATADELMALADLGYTARQLRETAAGRDLIARYGLGDPGWPAASQSMNVNIRKGDE